MSEKPTKCLFPDCTCKVNARGLCHNHYTTTRNLIYAGKITDDELVKKGKILPKRTRDLVTTSQWFLEAKDETGT